VDPCLALYERLGRYPGRFPKSLETLNANIQKAICKDIQGLESLVREVEYMVNEVRKSVEALQELGACFLQSFKHLANSNTNLHIQSKEHNHDSYGA
jgi:hypothetical protein